MIAIDDLTIGMSAEIRLVVGKEMAISHFVTGMPPVYATPMMILHMEMAAGSSIASSLPAGFVSVGTEVNVRHLAATPIGMVVRAIATIKRIELKSVLFEVEAWNEVRQIGEGTHRRGIVNVDEFERRLGIRQATFAL